MGVERGFLGGGGEIRGFWGCGKEGRRGLGGGVNGGSM